MATRVIISGFDAEEFDVDIEASEDGKTFRVDGPEVEALKAHLDGQGGGWSTCRFDVSCEVGTLRGCCLVAGSPAAGVVLICADVQPPAPNS